MRSRLYKFQVQIKKIGVSSNIFFSLKSDSVKVSCYYNNIR